MTKRRVLLFITAPLLVATIACIFWFQNAARHRAADDKLIADSISTSGSQLLVEGHPVNARLSGIDNRVQVGNASDVELTLLPIKLDNTSGLGNELDGTFTPTLSVTGCSVTSSQANPKATEAPVAAFDWHWSVVCSSVGVQDLQVTLAFAQNPGPPNGSDPVAYEYSQKVIVSGEPWQPDEISKVLSVLGTLITVISGVIGIFRTSPSGTRRVTEP